MTNPPLTKGAPQAFAPALFLDQQPPAQPAPQVAQQPAPIAPPLAPPQGDGIIQALKTAKELGIPVGEIVMDLWQEHKRKRAQLAAPQAAQVAQVAAPQAAQGVQATAPASLSPKWQEAVALVESMPDEAFCALLKELTELIPMGIVPRAAVMGNLTPHLAGLPDDYATMLMLKIREAGAA